MKRQLLSALLCCACTCIFPSAAFAQTAFDFEDIDTMLEDNKLTDAANRYASVTLSFFPERATRLGFSSANAKLNDRSAPSDALALNALRSVQQMTEEIKAAQLSAAKRTDLTLLKNAMEADIWELEQNRIENDPLYYTETFDAIYDLMLKKTTPSATQKEDLMSRVNELPKVAQQAQKNLIEPPAYLSQLAMERAYYAYLSFDEVTDFLLQGVEDEVSIAQIKRNCQTAKRAIKQMFDWFKSLSQDQNSKDFRLGEKNYAFILQNKYQITEKPAKLEKQLAKSFKQAQQDLAKALEPFALDTADEEVTVVDDLNANPTVESAKPAQQKEKKKGKFIPPTAQDFYKAAHRVASAPAGVNITKALAQDAAELSQFFAKDGTLPAAAVSFSVKPLPAFYAYTQAYLFVPPFGNQLAPTSDLFLRLPSGNKLAKQEQRKRDFNAPVRKLLLSGELVPGRYYQAVMGQNLSSIRRLYPSATTANGWSAYAQKVAQERGYISTPEELLFFSWVNYRRLAAALTEIKLQTKQYSYADAIHFLVTENGFTQEDAENIIKASVAHPGQSISYVYGLQSIEHVRKKYAKKAGKNFKLSDFHSLVLKAGNVPPADLEGEINRLSRK